MMMHGKRGVIMGIANDYSLAYGIAQQLHAQGAEIALTYQSEVLKKRIEPLAESLGGGPLFVCDVGQEGEVAKTFGAIKEKWGKIDFVLHSMAFADKDELKGPYYNTSLNNFLRAMHISCFSFTEVCKEAQAIMNDGGTLLTMSYYGAEKVMPHYNVMGVAKAALEASVRYLAVDLGKRQIRVNALSAGPARTLASSGIGDFHYILKWNHYNSPLQRNITLEDVGKAGFYLLSDLSSGVTGEVHHVDAGYHVVGMKSVDAPDISVV